MASSFPPFLCSRLFWGVTLRWPFFGGVTLQCPVDSSRPWASLDPPNGDWSFDQQISTLGRELAEAAVNPNPLTSPAWTASFLGNVFEIGDPPCTVA